MEEEKQGMSFGEIMGIIFSRKWLALAVAVILAAAVICGLIFGYNANSLEYTSTFSVDLPDGTAESPRYPDGTPFNYRELVTSENLEAAVKTEGLENIDIKSMTKSEGISVVRNMPTEAGDNDITYTLRVKAKYFKDADQADLFIRTLAQTPVNKVKTLIVDQDVYLGGFDSAEYLENKFTLLRSQYNYLASGISGLSSRTGGELKNRVTKLGTDLDVYKQKLDTALGEMRKNNYVINAEKTLALYENLKETVQDEYDQKSEALKKAFGDLESSGGSAGSTVIQPTESMVQLAKEVSELDSRLKLYQSYIDGMSELHTGDPFLATVESLHTELVTMTDSYEKVLDDFYNFAARVVFDGYVSESGGMGTIICIVIGVVAGIIVGALVAFAVGYAVIKKSQSAPVAVEMAENTQTAENAQAVSEGEQADPSDPDDKKQ